MEQSEPTTLSDEEFNARLARNVAIQAGHMKTLEEARRNTAGLRETNDAVDDLRRLREILMEHVERTTGRPGDCSGSTNARIATRRSIPA